MAFSYVDMMTTFGLGEYATLPNFDLPSRTSLTKPLSEMTVGMLVTCGVFLEGQPLFAETNDLSYRLIPRSVPVEELLFAHTTPDRVHADRDLSVAYPRGPMLELEAEGHIGRLSDEAVSIVGSISLYTELVTELVPKIAGEFERQAVDLVLLVPFCPACHRATCLIARSLERRGVPTLMITVLREMAEAFKPPRVVFLDFPLGCTVGRPFARAQQIEILRQTFDSAIPDTLPWTIHDLPFTYEADGTRDWEQYVKHLYAESGFVTHRAHVAEHESNGERLVGNEREFAIRCLC